MPNYIYEKCRNERRGSPNPVVLLHKRAKGSIKSSITVGLKRGGINWEPLYPEGEDETSLKKHVEYPSTITCICSGIADRLGKDREMDDRHIHREKANNEFAIATC